jgi:hypothetical protein
MLPNKYQKGFVDPLSLFAVVFLVVSLIVGTKVVTDRQRSLDIRNEAKMIADCSSDSDCGSGYKCIVGECITIPAPSTPKPTAKPSTEDDRLTEKEKLLDPGTPAPTPQAGCVADGKCIGPGESCCNGSYFDNSCYLTEARCGTKSSSSTPTPKAAYCSTHMAQVCTYGCEPTELGGKCKTAPTPTPSPTLRGNGYFCTTNSQCASGYCTYSPGGDKWCQDKPVTETPAPALTPEEEKLTRQEEQLDPTRISESVPYCTIHMAQVCTYGCQPSLLGGSCKNAPAATEEKTTLKTDGEICSRDNDCQSGKCQYASFGLNKCIAVLTEEEQKQQTEENLIAAGQFLNTITFGTFGDYVSTYVDINAQQPESTYLEKSFSQEGLASSAKLGAVLTAEGAALYFGGMALGGVSLAEIPISTTFGLPGITQSALYGTAVAQSALSGIPQGVIGLIRTTGVVLGNIGVYQGAKACQNDPGSLECTLLITGIQMGWMDDLARETGAFLEDAYEATAFMVAQSMDEAQVFSAIDPNMRRLMNLDSGDLLMAGVDDTPSFVTLDTGEIVVIGEQIGETGKQGTAYLGQTCAGDSCVVKLFNLDDIPEGFTEEALRQINTTQIDIMSTYGTAENTFLPQYYGSITDESGQAVGYAMEFIEGETLRSTVQTQGGVTSQQVTEVRNAIRDFQSTTNMPHGDLLNPWYENINTGNIIMTPDRGAVLIDPAGSAFQESAFYSIQDIMQTESYDLLRELQQLILK